MTQQNSNPTIDFSSMTREQILAIQEAAKSALPPAPKGRKALLSDERLIAIHSTCNSNREVGEALMRETLSNGKTGLQHWGSPEDASATASVRISKLRKDGKVTKSFPAGRPKDPTVQAAKVNDVLASMSTEDLARFMAERGLAVVDASETPDSE